jgi:hypothetical protein
LVDLKLVSGGSEQASEVCTFTSMKKYLPKDTSFLATLILMQSLNSNTAQDILQNITHTGRFLQYKDWSLTVYAVAVISLGYAIYRDWHLTIYAVAVTILGYIIYNCIKFCRRYAVSVYA